MDFYWCFFEEGVGVTKCNNKKKFLISREQYMFSEEKKSYSKSHFSCFSSELQ